MRSTQRLVAELMLLLAIFPLTARSQIDGETLPRTVLGIFDSATEQSARWSRVHRFAEMPLNHLGLRVRYWDIQQGWPDTRALAGVRGIVLWPRGYRIRDPEALWRGLEQAFENGIGVALLGGPYEIADTRGNPPPLAATAQVLRHFGLAYSGFYEEVSLGWRISHADTRVVEFERRLSGPLPGFGIYDAATKAAAVHLTVTGSLRNVASTSHLVTSQPGAAFVDSAFVLWHAKNAGEMATQWRVDPFHLFRRAFNTDVLPKLDPTTASNRRVMFALVDGDGWNERSNLFHYREQAATSADVLFREVLSRYTSLPFSVAPIGMDLDPQRPGTARARRTAVEIFSLPNVMPGLHSYSHPLRWITPAAEEAPSEVPVAVVDSPRNWRDWIGDYLPASWRPVAPSVALDESAKAATSPVDLELEFGRARAVVESVLTVRKPISLLHWTGDGMPHTEALQDAARRGWLTISGGPVMPRNYFSYSAIAPFGFVTGGSLQVYLGNENETDVLAGWPSAEALRRRLNATETPRRVTPLALYFQVGGASDTRRLNVLRTAIETLLEQTSIPTWPHVYAGAVAGFQSAELIAAGRHGWRIRDRGLLNTLRIDGATQRQVDFAKSVGVLAERRENDALYVALDPDVSEALLVLQDKLATRPTTQPPVLEHASWHLRGLRRNGDAFDFIATGFGEGDFHWHAAPESTFTVRVMRGAELLWQQEVVSDGEGRLRVTVPALAMTPVAMTLQPVTRNAGGTAT